MVEFYRETEFKEETGIGKLPKEWKVVTIRDIFDVETGTTPSTKRPEYWEGGTINWITPADLSKLNGRILIGSSERKITEKALKETSLSLIPKGSIILSTRAPVGYVAVLEEDATFNQGCKGLVPKDHNKLESLFYAYYLLSKKPLLQSLSGGSTFKELSKKALEQFKAPFPSIEEQKFIAGILFSMDEAIRAVDASIAGYERLKRGLMQELLTKGIGHKEFKEETEIGKIPASWKVVRLGDESVATIRRGKANKPHDYEKVAFIPMEKIPDNGLYAEFEMRPISDVKSFVYCEAGDILLAKITPCFENGKQGIVPEDVPNGFALATTEVFPIVCKEVNRFFLFYLLKMPKFRDRLKSAMRGTTGRLRVPRDAVVNLKIPLPPLDEQERIAKIILSVDAILEEKRRKKAKLERMKKAMMDLLLTGKIRVRA